VTHHYGLDGGVLQRIEHPINLGTGNTEHLLDPLRLQMTNHQLGTALPLSVFHDIAPCLSAFGGLNGAIEIGKRDPMAGPD